MAKSACVLALVLLAAALPAYGQGIAGSYPGDVGIQGHPDVILTEMFEETSTAPLFARWESVSNPGNITLDPDVPAGSPGTRSVRMVKGAGDNGASLYRRLPTGENDRVYMRYYIKYSSGGYHHAGGQLGGYNPPSPWPQGTAGIVPTGSDHFTIGLEPVDGPDYRFEFYVYWKDMSGIWGNYFIRDPSLLVPLNQWACCEIMVRLNNPVSAFNGELAVWINGQPRGPYTGLQWRTTSALNLNWVWLLHYVTTQTPAGSTQWDHLVVARSYIGPIGGGGTPPPPPPPPPPSDDTDGDGLPDSWEMARFGSLAQGPGDDPDGDGFTNLQEYQAGTDPTDAGSFPAGPPAPPPTPPGGGSSGREGDEGWDPLCGATGFEVVLLLGVGAWARRRARSGHRTTGRSG